MVLPLIPFLPASMRRRGLDAEPLERRLRVVRIDWPFPALELVRPDGHGWLLMRLPSGRYRLKVRDWPSRGLYLADTPRPNCPDCGGKGGWHHDYANHEGEYGGTDWVPCICWDDQLAVRLLSLPRARRDAGYSDEAPF